MSLSTWKYILQVHSKRSTQEEVDRGKREGPRVQEHIPILVPNLIKEENIV